MEIIRKRKDVITLFRTFRHRELSRLSGRKFSYFLEKNEGRVEAILREQEKYSAKAYHNRGKISEEFDAAERVLIEQYATKNEKGESFDEKGNYTIDADKIEEYNGKLNELYEQFGEEGQRVKNYVEIMTAYTEEEITIDLHHIKEDDLPDTINGDQRRLIKEFIIE